MSTTKPRPILIQMTRLNGMQMMKHQPKLKKEDWNMPPTIMSSVLGLQ
jgi:hypothetical protein